MGLAIVCTHRLKCILDRDQIYIIHVLYEFLHYRNHLVLHDRIKLLTFLLIHLSVIHLSIYLSLTHQASSPSSCSCWASWGPQRPCEASLQPWPHHNAAGHRGHTRRTWGVVWSSACQGKEMRTTNEENDIMDNNSNNLKKKCTAGNL